MLELMCSHESYLLQRKKALQVRCTLIGRHILGVLQLLNSHDYGQLTAKIPRLSSKHVQICSIL